MFKNIWFTKYSRKRIYIRKIFQFISRSFGNRINKGFHYYSHINCTQTLLYNWMPLLIILLSYISHAHTFYGSEQIPLFQTKFHRVHSIYKEHMNYGTFAFTTRIIISLSFIREMNSIIIWNESEEILSVILPWFFFLL